MRMAGKLGWGLALVLASWQALAVDVDRIEIRSRRGEPLYAEIPITGATPEDIRALQAQLASPTTFARIGLPRPQGVVADLRFEVVRGARPVIRVTSSQPVQEDFLTFLMQVDAPQGRLVREYSIALGAEPTLPDPVPQQIQAPVQSAPALVQRPIDPADALPAPPQLVEPRVQVPAAVVPPAEAAPIPLAGERAAPTRIPVPATIAPAPARRAAAAPASAPRASTPAQAPAQRRAASARTASAPAPAAAPAARPSVPARAAAPAPVAPRPGDYVVKPGDNLTGIVERMALPAASPAQAMLAVLRSNPDAFAQGNINQLRRGAVLRAPATPELARLSPAEAEAAVRLQIEQWRSGTIPPLQLQPEAAPQAAALPTPAAAPVPTPAGPPPIPVIPRTAQPRLEIAPAGADAAAMAGGGAGGSTPGEQERAAAEALALRYTEFQQMQQRVADMEQQQKLLLAQNAELAARETGGSGALAWLVAGLALLVAVAAVLWRRRAPARPSKATSALASRIAPPRKGEE